MKTEPMLAYHSDSAIKGKYLARVRAHREADQLIKGTYWEDGKGCAVGCTVHSSSHSAYENELGIPKALARIEDGIFEGLPNGKALAWPEQFLSAIQPGANVGAVKDQFLLWLLVDPADGVIRFAKSEKSKSAIRGVADLYARRIAGDEPLKKEWRTAAYAAAAAYDAAYDAAAAAAYAAAADYAAAAYDAYDAAAAAAYAAAADYAAAYAARSNARIRQSEKLLQLLAAAPMGVAA